MHNEFHFYNNLSIMHMLSGKKHSQIYCVYLFEQSICNLMHFLVLPPLTDSTVDHSFAIMITKPEINFPLTHSKFRGNSSPNF